MLLNRNLTSPPAELTSRNLVFLFPDNAYAQANINLHTYDMIRTPLYFAT